MKKRLISLLLALAMVLSFLLVPASAAEERSPAATQEPLKVLTFGNSFASDSMTLINSIAIAHGDAPMVVGWLFHGGCTLKMHCDYFKNNSKSYTYYKNTNGTTEKNSKSTALDGLLDEDWDLIFVQHGTGYSSKPGDVDPYLDELMGYINANKTNPNAEFGWNMTWGFQKACKDSGVATYSRQFRELFNGDTYAMYKSVVSLVQEKVLPRTVEVDGKQVPEFTHLIPSGTAIENARSSYFGDNLQRDTYHLNRLGRIIAAYAWYARLTGKTQLTSIELSDEEAQMSLSKEDRQVILESVNNALATPFERTLSKYTQRPAEDVYYVLDNPGTSGGTVEGYHQNDPTTKVTVSYTGKVKDVGAKGFYKLVDGQLVAQRIHDAKVATVSWHNYFVGYDANTRTLTMEDGTAAQGHGVGASKCGFRCIADATNGHYELPRIVYDVPATTPVVDVTGKDHGVSTLQDVADLAQAGYSIRLNHYSADASVPTAFYVDAVTIMGDFYVPQEGDVFFIPAAAAAGVSAEGYIIKSATVAAGTKKLINVPAGSKDATGFDGSSRGRFWTMESGNFVMQKGVWMPADAAGAYKFTYHDTITSYTPAAAGDSGAIKIKHAEGHTGRASACGWAFEYSCGQTSASDRYRETCATLSLTKDLTIIDLTGKDYSGRGITTLEKIMEQIEQGNVIVNVYAADGTKSAGTADVIVVLDPKPGFTPGGVETPEEPEKPKVPATPETSGEYTMQEDDVFYLLEPLSKGKEKKVLIASASSSTPGAVETITAPNGNGSPFQTWRLARVTETGTVDIYQNMTGKYGAGLKYKLGVHEPLKAVDTTNNTFTMGKFADGYHADRATCFWNSGSDTPYKGKGYYMGSYGAIACESTSFECQATNSYDANTAFMDLRTFQATGKISDIKALSEGEFAALAGDRSVMLDVYVPDGAKDTSGTASLVVIMPTDPTKNAVEIPDGPSIQFNDVNSDAWYYEAVGYVVENGVMSGYNASTFGPDDNLSRAMVVQVLYNYEGKPATEAEAKFPDVKAADWFYNATRWGAAKGVVSGYGDGRFGPNDNVTIEQVAVILHNYMGKPAGTADLASVGKYDDWAAGALQWAVANGVLKNVPFTNATDTATRAQTAQMLMNFLQK